MKIPERAAQAWSLLAFAATHRQTLTYELLAKLTGMHAAGLGAVLEPIQSYCLLHSLPPLTALVVNKVTDCRAQDSSPLPMCRASSSGSSSTIGSPSPARRPSSWQKPSGVARRMESQPLRVPPRQRNCRDATQILRGEAHP